MSRMLKALQSLAQQAEKNAAGRRARSPNVPRVAAPLRSKIALDSPTSVPSVLFSAPAVPTQDNCEHTIVVRPGLPAASAIPGNFQRPAPVRPTVALPIDPAAPSHEAFASLGQGIDSAVVRPWSTPFSGAPNAVFHWTGESPKSNPAESIDTLAKAEEEAVAEVLSSKPVEPIETPPEPAAIEKPVSMADAVIIRPRPSVWEMTAANELADAVRRNHFAELLRTIRRDVPPGSRPCVGFCGVESSRQTAETVLRIAIVAAEDESSSVLVVDANQVEPRVTDALDLTEAAGLVDLASSAADVSRLVRPTSHSRISVLPLGAGTIEHLGSARARLATFVQQAKDKYTTILVDLGPMVSPLAALVGSALDGAYVSVNLGATVAADAERLVKRIQNDGVRLFGCVVLQPSGEGS